MSKLTTRITAMLLSGMLVIGSVPGSVLAASTDVDQGQTSEIAQEVYEKDTGETPVTDGEMAETEETSEDSVGAGETSVESNPEESSAEEVAVQYYTVTLDANGGYFENEWDDAIGDYIEQAEVVEKHIPVDGTIASFPVFTNLDGQAMLFAGWSLERDGELITVGDEEYTPVGNCVLYAMWGANETREQEESDQDVEQTGVIQGSEVAENVSGDPGSENQQAVEDNENTFSENPDVVTEDKGVVSENKETVNEDEAASLEDTDILTAVPDADDDEIATEIVTNTVEEIGEEVIVDHEDNDLLFKEYAEIVFEEAVTGSDLRKSGKVPGDSLAGQNRIIFNALHSAAAEISAGQRNSAVVNISLADLGIDSSKQYTAEDLGLDYIYQEVDGNGVWNPDVNQAINGMFMYDNHIIWQNLWADCPYEMYWSDGEMKSVRPSYKMSVKLSGDERIGIVTLSDSIKYSITVEPKYRAAGGDEYSVDTVKTGVASAAATYAQSIVRNADTQGLTDYARLVYYKDIICQNVNSDNTNIEDRGAWNLIYVFDQDPSTNVIDEGYSKAFQYLCQLTTFRSDVVYTLCPTGTIGGDGGEGPHEWNIVRMDDGRYYMADVTNSDEGSVGYDGSLFLKGMTGSVQEGYSIRLDSGDSIKYTYDEKTLDQFSEEELTLSAEDYEEEESTPIIHTESGTCGPNLTWTVETEVGILTISGTGKMNDYEATGTRAPWSSYSINKVIIEEGVTGIGNNAFSGCLELTRIHFEGNAPSISSTAFTNVTATAYYPANDPTWTEDVMQNYGGNITWVEWDPNTNPSATSNTNDTIIERVREYTSDDLYAQYNAITEDTTISAEERFHRMNSLLCNYGFTNPKEGIKYISNVIDKRYAYLMLTTDDAYCANNYVDWLNSGLLAGPRRALLFADGLIFNNEINDWLSFTTYAESEYPGVKKYKTMLYDFMDATSKKTEIESGIKFASDLASKSTGVGKIEAENIVNSLNACKTTAEEREILRRAESEGVFASLEEARDENGNILLNYELDESSGFGQFQKSMGYATKTISIASMTISDILDIIELDSKLATYSQYKRFLQEVIHDTSVPFQMRWAASLIIGELDEGYLGKIKDVAMDIIGQTELNSTIKKAVLNKIGASSLSGWLTVISIDSFFVNQITNIGDLVKNEAYVEGYNYLSKSYKNRLEESKAAFQQNPTEANAWEFYYNYNILYNLRHKGEEAYLKMSKIGGLAGKLYDFGYTDKKAVVDNTLKMLEERCQFTFDGAQNIPESCQFASKAVVKCPVDVEVVSSDGTVMATLIDGEESDFTNSYGRFAVVYDYYSQDYYKVICLNENNDFTLRAKGNNKGLVSVELARADDVDQDIYVINNIPIEPEEVLSASVEQITENSTITRYTADESEGTEEAVVVTNDNYVPVDSIALNQEELVLAPGESALLNVTFEPADSTKQGVFWNSTDSDVASVTDGRIEAVSEGSAIIYCTSQDNSDLIKTCAVTVANPVYPIENFTVEGLEDKVYTGEAVNQHITLKNAENTLTEGVDYEVSYTNNTNIGTATVTITGKGNYTGTVSKTFTISAAAIANATVSGISNKTYTGSALTQNPTVKVGDQTLTKDTDYTVSYANNTNVGTATVTITGKGNYTGNVSKTFKINGISVSNATVSGISNKTYTGSAITQNPTVKVGDKTLTKNTDYTVSFKNNTNVGTATVTITGKGNYASKKNVTFKINKAAQSITAKAKASRVAVGKTTTVSITGNKGKKSYKPSNTAIATVTSAGKVTAKKVGTVKITATSATTANYNAASKTVTIKVVPAATASLTAANQATGIKLTWKKVTGANGYKVYRGSTLIKTITSGSTVSFVDKKANTNGTKYTYKVVAKATTGDSTLSKSRVIYRVSRPTVSSVTNSASKKMTVKWGKNAKANGYQIQYSTDKTFKTGNKAVSITSASTVSKVIGSLTKGKTYYVRIRTYKTVGSTKYWSIWSAARSVKISK